jgi:hypothetical protein
MAKCDNCGYEIVENPWGSGCDGIMSWDVDPFAEEIHGDSSLYWDCTGNRYQSAMDI